MKEQNRVLAIRMYTGILDKFLYMCFSYLAPPPVLDRLQDHGKTRIPHRVLVYCRFEISIVLGYQHSCAGIQLSTLTTRLKKENKCYVISYQYTILKSKPYT